MQGWENKPRMDLHALEAELEGFTTAQLLAEVARRERVLREQADGPLLCNGCIHQRFWKRKSDPPEAWTPCALLHAVDFKMPEGHPDTNGDWGFYRPGGCAERQEAPPPVPPPEPAPPPRGGRPQPVP